MFFHRVLNRVRHNYYFSHVIRTIARPTRMFCNFLSDEITKKIRINGGVVKYDGINLKFPKNIAMSLIGSIYWNGMHGYEPYNWQILRILLKKTGTRHFIDIGSNFGIYSILAKKCNPDLIVETFEPVPSIFEKNVMLHRENGLVVDSKYNSSGGSLRILQKAISNTSGKTTLHLPVNTTNLEEESTGTIRPDSWQADRQKDKIQIQVETITLDDHLKKIDVQGQIVIKIDVEDHEAAVFEGAQKSLAKFKPYIICEMLAREHGNQETCKILTSLKYKIFAITEKGLFIFNHEDFIAPRSWTDFFCVHEDILLKNNLNKRNYLSFNCIKKISG